MTNTHIERFVGDQVRRLQLTPIMITEVERTTGHGVLALYSAVIHRTARHRDLTEVVRAALIGGGTGAQEADTFVRIYIDGHPPRRGALRPPRSSPRMAVVSAC